LVRGCAPTNFLRRKVPSAINEG